MPKSLELLPLDTLRVIADSVRTTADRLASYCKAFEEAGIDPFWTMWSEELPGRVAAVATFADDVAADLQDQVLKKALKIECDAAQRKRRSEEEKVREQKRKAARKAAAHDLTMGNDPVSVATNRAAADDAQHAAQVAVTSKKVAKKAMPKKPSKPKGIK